MTHYDRILNHLKEFKSITSWQAIELYGCTRLSHYIYLLRKDGYTINATVEKSINRFGNTVHFYKYELVEGEENGD